MKKVILFSLFTLSLSSGVWAQKPAPTSTPTPVSDDSEVVKISTNLIQLDVTVTDSNGRVVSDIRKDEMEIYENGKKQEISNFLFVSSAKRSEESREATGVKPASGIRAAPMIRPEGVRRTIALVVDDLTLSFDSMHYVRGALKKFVDEQMEDGDLVAIIRTGGGIGVLQQFTSDKRILYAAIEKLQWNRNGTGGYGPFVSIGGRSPKLPDLKGVDVQMDMFNTDAIDKDNDDYRKSLVTAGTIDAADFIVRGMGPLPGRKSMMLLSNGFSLINTNGADERALEKIRRLADDANRGSVVVHTIDARGLVDTGFTAVDNLTGRSQSELNSLGYTRRTDLFNTQDGLAYLAESTGGKAVRDTNELGGEVRRLLDDQSYYLVGYQPDEETFGSPDRKFNKLEVRIARKGARVRYRSGFFGITDEKLASSAQSSRTPQEQMINALTSPFGVNDILLNLNVLFANDIREGAYIRPLLYLDGDALRFTDGPNGSKKAVFHIVGVIFGDNGQVVDKITKNYTFMPDADEYKKVMESGFVYNLVFPVKKPGGYQFRVAIRDDQTGKIGSASQFVEVPDLKKKNLTVSSIVLNNITVDGKNNIETGGHVMSDAAVRKFKKGSILSYSGEIYNAKAETGQTPRVETQVKIFRDEKLVMDGSPVRTHFDGQNRSGQISFSGALKLGSEMAAGRYVMQIDVADRVAGAKGRKASELVEFEIVE